jgi:hypothetical protein
MNDGCDHRGAEDRSDRKRFDASPKSGPRVHRGLPSEEGMHFTATLRERFAPEPRASFLDDPGRRGRMFAFVTLKRDLTVELALSF